MLNDSVIKIVDEKDNTLSEDEKIAETFNKFFGNIKKVKYFY